MSAQLGLVVWRVGVGVAGAAQDGAALDAGVEALFPQGKALQGFEAVLLRGAVNGCIPQDHRASCMVENSRVGGLAICVRAGVLQFPCLAVPVVDGSGGVVTLVEVFEDAG